jgi:ribosomal protein L24
MFVSGLFIQGCRSLFVNSPEKKAVKQQEKSDKEFQKNYSKIKTAHFKNQDKETRKRMKKNKKVSRKLNRSKKSKSKWDCK